MYAHRFVTKDNRSTTPPTQLSTFDCFSIHAATLPACSNALKIAPNPTADRTTTSLREIKTATGAIHWVKLAGILAPLVIGELVKDADKKWRYIRLASVATAIVPQEIRGNRVKRKRDDCQEGRKYGGRVTRQGLFRFVVRSQGCALSQFFECLHTICC
jgi:hypothetical protein